MRKKGIIRNKVICFITSLILAFSGIAFPGTGTGPALTGNVEVQAASAKLNVKKKTLKVGKSFTLKVKNASKKYTFTSSDPSVARIKTKKGKKTKVIAMSAGKATITAKLGKTELKCVVTVKGSTSDTVATPTPTQTPTPTPTPTEDTSTPHISPESTALNVGDKLQLKLVGDEAMEFFLPFEDDDSQFVEVTGDGLVTAKKPVNSVKIAAFSITGKIYYCDIKVLAPGANTGTDENGIGSDGLGSSEHYDIGKISADITLGDTYGLLVPHTREPYRKTMEFTIEREEEFIKACRNALEHGAEEFTIKFRMFDCQYWKDKFKERWKYYSDLSGYTADGFLLLSDDSARTLTIRPVYKDVWKAVTYLRYSGYETDDDIKKLLNAATELTNDAIEANPGDTNAILLYVNNRICEMTTYTQPIPTETACPQRDATGVFFYGDGVCESYTAAMRLVLNILGLQNDTILNKEGTHIWNRVSLNGTWYHIDATWNDVEDTRYGGYTNGYFLLTEPELIKKSTASDDPKERNDHLWYNFYN